jgi:hypothetical protein
MASAGGNAIQRFTPSRGIHDTGIYTQQEIHTQQGDTRYRDIWGIYPAGGYTIQGYIPSRGIYTIHDTRIYNQYGIHDKGITHQGYMRYRGFSSSTDLILYNKT